MQSTSGRQTKVRAKDDVYYFKLTISTKNVVKCNRGENRLSLHMRRELTPSPHTCEGQCGKNRSISYVEGKRT